MALRTNELILNRFILKRKEVKLIHVSHIKRSNKVWLAVHGLILY